MFTSIHSQQWRNEVDAAYAELRRLREAAADLHKLSSDTRELIACSRDAMRDASARPFNSPPAWMRARFAWPHAKPKIIEITE
jgi:hypothetical protein